MKKLSKILILSLVVLTFAGCGKIPTLKNGEEAVVTTDNGSISANDLYEEIKKLHGRDVLIQMIDNIILENMYDETKDEKDEINLQIEQLKNTAKENNVTYSYVLNYYGFKSEEDAIDYIRLNYRRNKAVNSALEKKLTEKEINNYYKNEIYGDIKVKHILIAPESLDGMSTSEIEKAEKDALNKAKEVIKKLNNGEKWADLVKKYSNDSNTASKEGDLGWFNTGEMQEDFEEKAFALKKGKYTTTPAKTSYGYHIILKTDEKIKPELKNVKDEIIETIVQQKLTNDTTLYNKTLQEIRKNANLEIIDSELSKQYNSYVKELNIAK